jgi:3-dehydrosphinganine reductase
MAFLGYASYCPGKQALRGLADTLYNELALYDINVHLYLPGTMLTAGFDEENKTKPVITRKIESTDEGITGDQAALAMYNGTYS